MLTGMIWAMTDRALIDLGKRVESARLDRGWSKEHAARLAGISAITWKRVEDGLSVQDAKRSAVLRAVDLQPETVPREPDMGEQMRRIIERQRELEQRLAALEGETEVG